MKQIKVQLPKDQIVHFCDEADKVRGDVNAKRDHLIVDAKSLLGVAVLGASSPMTVEYPDDATEFESFLKQFEVKKN